MVVTKYQSILGLHNVAEFVQIGRREIFPQIISVEEIACDPGQSQLTQTGKVIDFRWEVTISG